MKRGLVWGGIAIGVLVVVGVGLSRMGTSAETNNAKERVRRLFDTMKPGGDPQTAIFLYWTGKLVLPPGGQEEFNRAADAFEAWKAQRDIKQVSSYEIKDAVVVEEAKGLRQAVVTVSGTLDGRPFKLRVVQLDPLEWLP